MTLKRVCSKSNSITFYRSPEMRNHIETQNIGRETKYFHHFVQNPKTNVLRISAALGICSFHVLKCWPFLAVRSVLALRSFLTLCSFWSYVLF